MGPGVSGMPGAREPEAAEEAWDSSQQELHGKSPLSGDFLLQRPLWVSWSHTLKNLPKPCENVQGFNASSATPHHSAPSSLGKKTTGFLVQLFDPHQRPPGKEWVVPNSHSPRPLQSPNKNMALGSRNTRQVLSRSPGSGESAPWGRGNHERLALISPVTSLGKPHVTQSTVLSAWPQNIPGSASGKTVALPWAPPP
jgi:hypothetical protein